MDRILYRKLAFKSQMKFGKYSEETVEKLIELGQVEYLKWVYYNMSNIDFLPEVLDAIRITDRIEKPGTAPELFEKYKKDRDSLVSSANPLRPWDSLTEEEKLECFKRSAVKKMNQRKRKERAMRKQAVNEYLRELSPSQLQGANHGRGLGKKSNIKGF